MQTVQAAGIGAGYLHRFRLFSMEYEPHQRIRKAEISPEILSEKAERAERVCSETA